MYSACRHFNTGLTFLPMAVLVLLVARSAPAAREPLGVRPLLVRRLTMRPPAALVLYKIRASGSALPNVLIPGLAEDRQGSRSRRLLHDRPQTQSAKEGQAGLASAS